MISVIQLILVLIACCPRHELNRDPVLLAEVAGYFEAAGARYDVPPTLLVYYYYREASLRIDLLGKLGEVGLPQVHGVTRRRCEDAGYDPTTWRGGIYCGALLIDDSRRFCGSLERGLVRYASGSCVGTDRTRKKIKQRLRAWRMVAK
jgi:hypothetical protein